MQNYSGEPATIIELADATNWSRADVQAQALEVLESGGIVHLPQAGFELTPQEHAFVSDASVTLPTRAERKSRNGRPTVIFDPDRGRLVRSRIRAKQRPQVEALLSRYAKWSEALVRELFPRYAEGMIRERTTYRPCERATTQGLHVDASYGRPTEGQSMLRVFCNINPEQRVRTWRVGESFEPFAARFVPHAKPRAPGMLEKTLWQFGITKGRRTAYDLLMEDIRGQAKRDRDYQAHAPQRVVDFPTGSVWIAFTDLVLHGAVSGQHSLDQTFYIPDRVMTHPERSSLRTLERLTHTSLVDRDGPAP